MNEIARIYMNIAMESVCLVYMIILLVTILMKKKWTNANRLFVGITVIEIALLIIQLLQWIFIPNTVMQGQSPTEIITTYILYNMDFSMMFFSMVLFCFYVFERVSENKKLGRKSTLAIKYTKIIIMVYSAVICLIYFSSIVTGFIYKYDANGNFSYNGGRYRMLLDSMLLIVAVCFFVIIKNWKSLGNTTSIIMLLFTVARIFVLPYDLQHGTSFSYIFLAIVIMVLYFGVDLRKEKMMHDQEIQIANQNTELEIKNNQITVSQIQPHFLYNTLSVIDYLCGSDPELARKAVNAFSNYLRMNMESITSLEPVPFEKELEHTKTYLWIEKLRFDDILNIEYDIETTDFQIPPLAVQPLCENAVKHGIRGKEDGGTVKLKVKNTNDKICIVIEDDGIGFDVESTPNDNKTHIGIESVRKRLEAMCNGKLEIISNPGEGTRAVITLEKI